MPTRKVAQAERRLIIARRLVIAGYRNDLKLKILVASLTLVLSLVKLATQFSLANNYNPLGVRAGDSVI